MDYNKTINLPKTEFPMRAGLPKREPDMLKGWNELELYQEMYKRNEGRPAFNLHDGPPFSNGSIHMGTAMNKCLKDFIVLVSCIGPAHVLPPLELLGHV